MTGASKVASSSPITGAGREEEEERSSRSRRRATISRLRGLRARIAWCMVGTAVIQVGAVPSSQAKKRSALKPGVQITVPPASSEASTPAISPWMWKSGMMLRQRSPGPSESQPEMLRAEAQRFAPVSGTILGRDVVPEVWSTSAASSLSPSSPAAAAPAAPAAASRVKAPAPALACASGVSPMIGTPTRCAASTAAPSVPLSRISALARRSSR